MNPAFINARAVALERYLRAVVRELPSDPEVASFLGIGTASTQEAKLTSFPWTFRTGGASALTRSTSRRVVRTQTVRPPASSEALALATSPAWKAMCVLL